MGTWTPSASITPLWGRLESVLPRGPGLVDRIVDAIATLSLTTWEEMSEVSQEGRRDQYLIRYTIPLAELAGWPDRADTSLFEALALHWLFAVAWRRLDDVLDSPVPRAEDIARLSSHLLRLGGAQQSVISRIGGGDPRTAGELLTHMCKVAAEERLRPLSAERIWERAAPFLAVPRTVLRLSSEEESAYRDFLCVDGLAHDIHDMADDFARGIRSLPATWLGEIDSRRAFRREVLEVWLRRAADELKRAVARARGHDPERRFRGLAFWLDVAEEASVELGGWCDGAEALAP